MAAKKKKNAELVKENTYARSIGLDYGELKAREYQRSIISISEGARLLREKVAREKAEKEKIEQKQEKIKEFYRLVDDFLESEEL